MALARMAALKGRHPQLLQAVMDINADRRRQLVDKAQEILGNLKGKVIGLLGLTFKPNTDDLREAPALDIAHILLREGVRVRAYDPVGMMRASAQMPQLEMCADPYAMAEGCEALIVCTEWNEFRHLDLERIRRVMRRPIVVDGRNIYEPEEMAALGFEYRGMGRGYGPDGSPVANHPPSAAGQVVHTPQPVTQA